MWGWKNLWNFSGSREREQWESEQADAKANRKSNFHHCSNKLNASLCCCIVNPLHCCRIFLKVVTIPQIGSILTKKEYCCWLVQFVHPNGLTCFCIIWVVLLPNRYRPLFDAIRCVSSFAIGGVEAHSLISVLHVLAAMYIIIVYQTPKAFCAFKPQKYHCCLHTGLHCKHRIA